LLPFHYFRHRFIFTTTSLIELRIRAMDRIPNELVDVICDFLPHEHLRKLRHVSRRFADGGAPKLFRRLVFHASYASFNRIRSVSENSKLRIHVKTVV
jgi:hypothetical protein